jgi:glycosyltransferase involved in cell wall biosynthesis
MRIAFFSDNFYPELSGIADSILTLGKELARRGHFVHFYAPYYGKEDYEKIHAEPKELEIERVTITRFSSWHVPAATGQARLVVPTGLREQAMHEWKPDVLHSQLFFGVGLEALIASRRLEKPFVGTNHTAISEFVNYFPLKSAWLKRKSVNYAVWYYNKCNFVTAPSQSVFDEMLRFGFNEPHQVLSNPITTTLYARPKNVDRAALKKKYGLSEKTLVYAGRLAGEKCIDVLIRALPLMRKRVPDAELALAGHGKDLETLKQLARELGVENAVHFLGTLSQANLAEVYWASELFATMSTSETQGMTVLQAMAANLPVLVADARSLPEYVPRGTGYVIPVGDAQALAKKAADLFKNALLRAKIGEAAKKYVARYSVGSVTDAWEHIYQKTIVEYKKKA